MANLAQNSKLPVTVLPRLGSVALTSDCCLFQHQIFTLLTVLKFNTS